MFKPVLIINRQYIRKSAVKMFSIIILYKLFCVMFYMLMEKFKIKGKPFKNARRVLLVTAHPDDECMFFGPMIMKLKQERCQIYLLCLSMGDAYNAGIKRKQELWDACNIIGIPSSNITLYKSPHLPDDPAVMWEENLVANLILNQIEIIQADVVITFDEDGISGHLNHCSLFYAMALLCLQKRLPAYCRVYVLESVNILRKYSLLLDGPISYFMSSVFYSVSWKERCKIKKAMEAHRTQLLWFRHLYLMFSRYMYFNTFKEIELAYL